MGMISDGIRILESDTPFASNAIIDTLALKSQTDEAAMVILLTQFAPLINRWIYHVSSQLVHESRDVIGAEVRFLFLELLHEWKPERVHSFTLYISCQLPQRVRNWVRLQRRVSDRYQLVPHGGELDVFYSNVNDPSPEPGVSVANLSGQQQALAALPERQRRVIELLIGGYSEVEIASRLNISQQRVNKLRQEAKKILRNNWDNAL